MKQIRCNEPFHMEYIDTLKPTVQHDDDVLIHIKRIGICGTDIHAYAGNQPFFDYPRILGHELAGVVEEVGTSVNHVKTGDNVTVIPYINCGECVPCKRGKTNCCTSLQVIGVHCDGGMGEYLVVPAQYVVPVDGLTLDQAATIEPLSIGAHAVRRANIQTDDSVLVIGAGPIGLGVARFAKLMGVKTYLMDIDEQRLIESKEWAEVDNTFKPNSYVAEQLCEVNGGHLPTIVFDATGNQQSMESAFNFVENGGTLVFVGLMKKNISFHDPDFHAKEMTLKSSRNATPEDFEHVISMLRDGSVKPGYVTKYVDFEEAIAYFEAGDYKTNKAQIVFE